MIVSIHQPNYLPWLGYFDKINRSDIFVVMDNVQVPNGRNHFGHRNKLKSPSGFGKWITLPIEKDEKEFRYTGFTDPKWYIKHCEVIRNYYRGAKYIDDYIDQICDIIMPVKQYDNLAALNIAFIEKFCYFLNIDTEIILSSSITDRTGFERIQDILLHCEATKYISGTGPGSMRYINEDWFKTNNIELEWQNYIHPTYSQLHGEFVSHLSVLDLIMNEGPKAADIIHGRS